MNKIELLDISKKCFDTYKHRLSDIKYEEDYKVLNNEIIDFIQELNVVRFSFSITSDPSLHFFIRVRENLCLCIEMFLDEENDTYIQILGNEVSFKRNQNFHNFFFN